MGRRTRECYLCGTKYEYCPTCTQDKAKPAFMSEFHSENCKNIFDICTRFNMKLMSKKEAQEAILNCDLSNQNNFKSYVQHDISEILRDDEAPKKRGKRIEIKPVDEVIDVEPEMVEPIIEEVHEVVETIENE